MSDISSSSALYKTRKAVAPLLNNRLIDLIMGRLIGNTHRVRLSAMNYNGYCVWRFSQMKTPVVTISFKSQRSMAGICMMLTAHWLYQELCFDRSLKEVINPSGLRRDLDLSFITQVAAQQDQYQLDQYFFENWLKSNGIVKSAGTSIGGNFTPRAQFADSDLFAVIDGRRTSLGSIYGTLSIHGWILGVIPAGHALGFRIMQDGKTSLFDPNYGEFYFNNYNNFKTWWPEFFQLSGYRKNLGANFELLTFKR